MSEHDCCLFSKRKFSAHGSFFSLTAANKTKSHTTKRMLGEIVGATDPRHTNETRIMRFMRSHQIVINIIILRMLQHRSRDSRLDMILHGCARRRLWVHFTSSFIPFTSELSSVVSCPCKGEHRPLLFCWRCLRIHVKPFHAYSMEHNEFHFPLKLLNSKPHDDEREIVKRE